MKKKHKVLLITIIITLLVSVLFLGWGLNINNYQYNLKRRTVQILAILVASICTGYTSVAFQTITQNQILTPSIMGLESLYRFLQTFVVFIFGMDRAANMNPHIEFFITVILMVSMSIIIFKVIFRSGSENLYFVVLLGIIMGTLFNGLSTSFIMMLNPNEFLAVQESLFASVNSVNKDLLSVSALIVLAVMLLSIRDYRNLDVANLGRNMSLNLGVDYNTFIKSVFIKIAVLVSISTVLIGPISFLSIIVVSIARRIICTYEHKYFIFEASLLSFIFLVMGTWILRVLFNNATQLSVLINFIGGSYFLYLLIRNAQYGRKSLRRTGK